MSIGLAWTTVAIWLAPAQSSHGAPIISIGFEESEGYSRRSAIETVNGWSSSEEGSGVIAQEERLFGEQSLRIEADEQAVEVGYRAGGVPSDGVRFIEVGIKPVPIRTDEATVTLNLWGSEIGFVRDDSNTIHVCFLSIGTGGAKLRNISTSSQADIDGQTGPWLNLVVRQDLGAAMWDLFLDGELVASDLRLGEAADSLGMKVGAYEAVHLDGLEISTENPLFPDSNADGMPDTHEIAHRPDSDANDRNGDRDGDGVGNIVEYLAGTPTSVAGNGAAGQVIYVDNVIGNDANSGLVPYGAGGDGPKSTIKAAMIAAQNGAVIVVMPGTGIYNEGSRSAKGKRITIRPVSPIVIK